MKTLYISILAIFGVFTGGLLTSAQQVDPPTMELDAGSVDTAIGETSSVPIEIISMDLSSTDSSRVGGDGEDIGAPEPELRGTETTDIGAPRSDGTELDDIGVVSQGGSAAPGVEPDEIDVSLTSDPTEIGPDGVTTQNYDDVASDGNEPDGDSHSFGVEREMKESGEKGGTEDMNIGIGEHSATDNEHKDWIIIESMSSPLSETRMNKAELIDSIANNSDGGLRSGYVKLGDIKGESSDEATDDGLDLDNDSDGATAARTSKPKEIVVVGSKVRDENVPQIRGVGDEESAQPDSFFDIWIDAGEDRNAQPDSFFDIFVDAGEDRNAQPDSFFDIFVDVSDEDLHLQAVSIAQYDDTIKEIELGEVDVRVEFDENVKLFGLIPIQSTRTIYVDSLSVDKFERVKVKFPWWHIFAANETDAIELDSSLEEQLGKTIPDVPSGGDDRPTEEVAFYYNKIQAQTLQTISNVSKASDN